MDRFSELFAQYTKGECDYLRVKAVEINNDTNYATIWMYVREDKYDRFDNNIIPVLKGFFSLFVKNHKLKFNFERLVISDDIVRRYLNEYLSVHYPFFAANIFLKNIQIGTEKNHITCVVPIPKGLINYAKDNRLLQHLTEELQEQFMTSASVDWVATDQEVQVGQQDIRSHISNAVEVDQVDYVCGRKISAYQAPIMLSSINEKTDRISVCGIVSDIKEYVLSDEEAEKSRGYRYRLSFTLNDTTASTKVYLKSKDAQCPIKDMQGKEVLVVGRTFYSERTQSFGVSATTVFSCKIDFAKIKAAQKPLPCPSQYRYSPLPVAYHRKPLQLTLEQQANEEKYLTGKQVYLYIRYVGEAKVPFEICALKVQDGHPVEKYASFIYMSDTSEVDVAYKGPVASAPRMIDMIPDLVRFFDGALVVCIDLEMVQTYLVDLATSMRYAFSCDWYDADLLLRKGKVTRSFAQVLSANKIELKSPEAYDGAVALFELYERLNLH